MPFIEFRRWFWLFIALCPLPAFASPFDLLSAAQPKPDHHTPSGSSGNAWLSPNLDAVFYCSDAWDITTNEVSRNTLGRPYFHIYRYDLATKETSMFAPPRESKPGSGGNSMVVDVSSDGRLVLIESDSFGLVEGDTNKATDVFVWDQITGDRQLVSKNNSQIIGDGPSDKAMFLNGGRAVFFASAAKNLQPPKKFQLPVYMPVEFFIWDLDSSQLSWRSLDSLQQVFRNAGPSDNSFWNDFSTEPNGRFLIWGAQYLSTKYLLFYDREQKVSTNLQSKINSWTQQTGVSGTVSATAISAGGRHVALSYGRFLLVGNLVSGEAKSLDVSSGSSVGKLQFSKNGEKILFEQTTNFASARQLGVWDFTSSNSTFVTTTANGELASSGTFDGRFVGTNDSLVSFMSSSTNLVPGLSNQVRRLYVKDLMTGGVELVTGADLHSDILGYHFSPDGSALLFETVTPGPSDLNNDVDVFLLWRTTGVIEPISRKNPRKSSATASKWTHWIPPQNRVVGHITVFSSAADDLVANDNNGVSDIFRNYHEIGLIELVSQSTNGQSGNGQSFAPQISNDGRSIAYFTKATDIAPIEGNISNSSTFVILNTPWGQQLLVNTNHAESPIAPGSELALSSDGTKVAFTVIAGGVNKLSVFDLATRELKHFQYAGIKNFASVQFSPSGRWLYFTDTKGNLIDLENNGQIILQTEVNEKSPAFSFAGTNLVVYRYGSTPPVLSATNLVTGSSRLFTGNPGIFAVSADASKLAYFASSATGAALRVENLIDPQTPMLPFPLPLPTQYSRLLTFLGNDRLAIHTRDALLPGDTNGFPEIYIYDIKARFLARLDRSEFSYFKWSNKAHVYNATNDFLLMLSNDPSLAQNDYNHGSDLFKVSVGELWDSDADTLPDSWEHKYFNSIAGSRSIDSDQDGFVDKFEYLLGSNPSDQQSRPKFSIALNRGSPAVSEILLDPFHPSLRYWLEEAVEPIGFWSPIPINESRKLIPNSSDSRFFRVRIELGD